MFPLISELLISSPTLHSSPPLDRSSRSNPVINRCSTSSTEDPSLVKHSISLSLLSKFSRSPVESFKGARPLISVSLVRYLITICEDEVDLTAQRTNLWELSRNDRNLLATLLDLTSLSHPPSRSDNPYVTLLSRFDGRRAD